MRKPAAVVIAVALCAGLSLSACASNTGDIDLDPSTWFPDGKKKLPGERRELFPGGVPGVTQGVPPELIKGSAQQQAEQNPEIAVETPVEPPKPQAQKKPRPKRVARPARPADAEAQPAQQQAVQPANSAWPAPPAAGTFTR